MHHATANVERPEYTGTFNHNLPAKPFHALRHSAATYLPVSGVNVKVVSETLGHCFVSITLSIFARLLPHMQQAAMEGLIGEPLIYEPADR